MWLRGWDKAMIEVGGKQRRRRGSRSCDGVLYALFAMSCCAEDLGRKELEMETTGTLEIDEFTWGALLV